MLSYASETLTLVSGMDIDAMSGVEFEAYVGGVLRHNGYLVDFTKATGDFGVDLVARRGTDVIAVQCKRRIKPVGAAAVQQVVAGAVMYQCLSTMVISNQSFTSAAVALAERHKCLLIDGSELSRLAEGWHPEARKDRFAKKVESVVSGARRGESEGAEEISVLERFSRNARVAVVIAREEAGELNLDEVRPSHVLVGVLQAAGVAEPATSDRAHELGALLSGYGLDRRRRSGAVGEGEHVRRLLVRRRCRRHSSRSASTCAPCGTVSREPLARMPSTTACLTLAGAAAAAVKSRSHARPRKCSSWHCEKLWCTGTTRSAASTSCWVSCEVATKRPSA